MTAAKVLQGGGRGEGEGVWEAHKGVEAAWKVWRRRVTAWRNRVIPWNYVELIGVG